MKYLAGLLLCSSLLFSAQSEQLVIDAKNFEADDKKLRSKTFTFLLCSFDA